MRKHIRTFLEDTRDILVDYDGYRSAEKLMELIDEVRGRLDKVINGKITKEDVGIDVSEKGAYLWKITYNYSIVSVLVTYEDKIEDAIAIFSKHHLNSDKIEKIERIRYINLVEG